MAGFGANVLRLNSADNVVVALMRLESGQNAEIDGLILEVVEPIPFGHKLALRPIANGDHVIKYGEIIGLATSSIEPGQHVHVHNLRSARLPGQK